MFTSIQRTGLQVYNVHVYKFTTYRFNSLQRTGLQVYNVQVYKSTTYRLTSLQRTGLQVYNVQVYKFTMSRFNSLKDQVSMLSQQVLLRGNFSAGLDFQNKSS